MKQYFKTKVDKNGNIYNLIIDHENRTFNFGYGLFSIFTSCDPITTTKKDIRNHVVILEESGYKRKETM